MGSLRLVSTLAVALTLSACGQAESPLPLVGTLERDRIEVPAQAWEVIVDVQVREGDAVMPGQLLMRQDPAQVLTRVAQSEAAVGRTARRLAELERGPRAEEIKAARARLEGAESQLEADRKAFRRTTELVEDALLSDSDLDQARARWQVSVSARDEAAARLAELVTGTTAEELDQARAALQQAQAERAEQQLLLARLDLRAPVAGIVDALPHKLGDRPAAGATVAVILAGPAPFARVYVPEPLRARLAIGTTARVTLDGVPAPLSGRIRRIASDPSFTPYFALTERDRSRLAYVAEVTLTGDGVADLPTGLPLEVDFPGVAEAAGR